MDVLKDQVVVASPGVYEAPHEAVNVEGSPADAEDDHQYAWWEGGQLDGLMDGQKSKLTEGQLGTPDRQMQTDRQVDRRIEENTFADIENKTCLRDNKHVQKLIYWFVSSAQNFKSKFKRDRSIICHFPEHLII